MSAVRLVVSLALAALLAALAAGCGGGSSAVRTVSVEPSLAAPGATGRLRLYGHIASLERRGAVYELRFDPASFLTGVTANVAAAEDAGTSCRPRVCPPVPNDNYVVDESHRSFAYIVPASVRGTVLTRKGMSGGPFPATAITVAQLAELVGGNSRLKLFEPLSSGVWVLVRGDTVCAFAQQYVP